MLLNGIINEERCSLKTEIDMCVINLIPEFAKKILKIIEELIKEQTLTVWTALGPLSSFIFSIAFSGVISESRAIKKQAATNKKKWNQLKCFHNLLN